MREPWVTGAVEGHIDEVVLRRLLREHSLQCTAVYGKHGKADLIQKLAGYNHAAQHNRWCVLIDLDHDAECAPELVGRLLPSPAEGMLLRVAVHEVESWLLADRRRIAQFLGVPLAQVPMRPDHIDAPKQLMVGLARGSRLRAIREDLVPRPESGRKEGPAYTSQVTGFVLERWQPADAARYSDSLARCMAALERLRR